MQAFAIAVLGISVADFEEMDCDEFEVVSSVWHEREETLRHDAWERARIVGVLAVSPYSKGTIRPTKILPFPWDNEQIEKNRQKAQVVSKEEDKARLTRLMESLRGKS